jgi:hypothetical protein
MLIEFGCDPALFDRLPRPGPAIEALPDWLRAMPRTAASAMRAEPVRTVKQCPPFVDAMGHGFVIPLPCDVVVRDGTLSWDWELPDLAAAHHPRAPLSFHAPAQVAGTPFHADDRVIVKFNSFWTVTLEPGWSLFATHPVNRTDLPFRLLTGLIEADQYNAVGLLFPAIWVDPGFAGTLPRGTPIAQCFPVPRTRLELVHAPFGAKATQQYDALAGRLLSGPGVYRRDYRSGPGGKLPLQSGGAQPEPSDGG